MEESHLEPLGEVFDALTEAGEEHPSSASLGRLRKAGLIGEPTVRHVGRPEGTVSEYPPGTTRRLLRLLPLRRRHRTLKATAWALWWEDGGELTPLAREHLQKVAKQSDRVRAFLNRLLDRLDRGSESAERRSEQLYRASIDGRLGGVMAAARRRVGRAPFSTVVHLLMEIGAGRFQGYEEEWVDEHGVPTAGTPAALLERALGLDYARRDALADTPPWYSGDSGKDMRRLSRILGSPLIDRALVPDSQLNERRRELQAFTVTVSGFAEVCRRLFGPRAFGVGLFVRTLQSEDPGQQALALLGWSALAEEADLQAGMGELSALAPRVEAWLELMGLLDLLREEVPGVGELLTDRRIGRALRDRKAQVELIGRVERARSSNLEAIEQFNARHPELERCLLAAQGI